MRRFLFVLSLCGSLSGFATTYYLSPTGNDSAAGSMAAPWHTLVKAWSVLQPGDTLYLRGGQYRWDVQQYLQLANGTAGNLIKVWAYPGETPILSRSTAYLQNTNNQDLIYFEGDYIHFKGLEIANNPQIQGNAVSNWSAFRTGSSNHCIWEQINYHHNSAGFSIRGDSTGNLVLNSDFHHNADPFNSAGAFEGSDGLNVSYNPNANAVNTVRGCRAWWNGDDGFDFWRHEGKVILENSWAFYNGYVGDTFNEAGNGSGIKLGIAEFTNTAVLRVVRNNIAYKNRSWGFVENNSPIGMQLFNNTAARNGSFDYWFGSWGSRAITVRNNITFEAGASPFLTFSSGSTLDHNSWTGGIDVWFGDPPVTNSVTASDFASLDDAQLVAPRKADGSLPDITFMHLASRSPLVNAGVDVGLPFVGSAPDIGAFEFDPNASTDGGTGGGSANGGGAGSTGGGSAVTGGGSAVTGGGSAVTGGGSAVTGGGSAVTGGGSAVTGGGSAVTGGGSAVTGGGSAVTGGGSAVTGGGSSSMGGGAASCLPGQSVACVGVAGCSGGQICNADGMSFGACDCGVVAPDGGSGSSVMGQCGCTSSPTGFALGLLALLGLRRRSQRPRRDPSN